MAYFGGIFFANLGGGPGGGGQNYFHLSFCGISGDLTPSTRKLLVIAIV